MASVREELRKILEGCSRCDFDEAEGELVNHCDACCRKVTRFCYLNFHKIGARRRRKHSKKKKPPCMP